MPQETAKQLQSLPRLSYAELCRLWKESFGRAPPARFPRELLIRSLAYRIQEAAQGALRAATRRRLKKLAEQFRTSTAPPAFNAPSLKPGTRLIREWRGDTHEVSVVEEGFTYRGRRYRSLSEIARLITGTRWSGPLFFGLKSPQAKREEEAHAA